MDSLQVPAPQAATASHLPCVPCLPCTVRAVAQVLDLLLHHVTTVKFAK